MRKFSVFVISACFLLATGCARQPVPWQPSGGSRSDASIRLSCLYNTSNEIPAGTEEELLAMADARCKSWGYAAAESYGFVQKKCNHYITLGGLSNCAEMMLTREYQCIGRDDSQVLLEKNEQEMD